ncbi:MAG: hypothetical protein HQM12_21840 [SAR324 cluster bacterium]|nr:hypothetical protein [SAR324 cluster bacterium]
MLTDHSGKRTNHVKLPKTQKEVRNAHNQTIQRYRSKQLIQKKRVETWIEQPQCLEILKTQSGLNQTQVINQLLLIVSDGVSREFFQTPQQGSENAELMMKKLVEIFQKL